mgnify:FL=1|tara:strand:+ start:1049 stop:2488 length:1440 start_codon:yes stop_codon:yes gene_type:complete
MTKLKGYIKKEERKKILLLCDDIRVHSGIATMAREIVVNSAHTFNWFNVGAAIKHPDIGKILDISEELNKQIGIDDVDVKILPSNGYGDATLIRKLLKTEDIDAIMIFTDPRYWTWLFEIEREIRSQVPIIWYNIWDDYPAPLYNKNYYRSVDTLLAISKQTKTINEIVLDEYANDKLIKYVPHGIDEKVFYPIAPANEDFIKFKNETLKNKELDFVAFFNSRNIARKHPHDLVLGYRLFCDMIGEEAAKKCGLVMHTQVVDQHGTDLKALKEALCDPAYVNILFSTNRLTSAQLNCLYNIADVTVLPSSNEGWGLSLTESMMSGTMIIANVTGGMQDQMRFEDDKGEWFTPSPEIPSNHRGTYKKHGEWAIPVFPNNISLQGSPATPYIYDDRCNPEDIATALLEAYNLNAKERNAKGMKGREWALSEEASFTSKSMTEGIVNGINQTLDDFEPRGLFELIEVQPKKPLYIKHKLTGY